MEPARNLQDHALGQGGAEFDSGALCLCAAHVGPFHCGYDQVPGVVFALAAWPSLGTECTWKGECFGFTGQTSFGQACDAAAQDGVKARSCKHSARVFFTC